MFPHHLTLSLTIRSASFSEGTFAMPVVKDRMIIILLITAFIVWCPKEITCNATQCTLLKVFLSPTSPENTMIKHSGI